MLDKGPKMGVYVDGVLKLQSRNWDKINNAAARWMEKRHDVWVAKVGCFVTK